MAEVTITWTSRDKHGGVSWTRAGLAVREPSLNAARARARIQERWGEALADLAADLQRDAIAAYSSISEWTTRSQYRGGAVRVSLTVRNPTFFYHEYDTQPHWPPFGKATPLAAWATARGLNPFYVARQMAPITPTNAVRGGHRMTVGGWGGSPSHRVPGRMVATRGQYKITDLVSDVARFLDTYVVPFLEALVDEFGTGTVA